MSVNELTNSSNNGLMPTITTSINSYLLLHSDIISSIINTIKPPHNMNVIRATSMNTLPDELYCLIMIVTISY